MRHSVVTVIKRPHLLLAGAIAALVLIASFEAGAGGTTLQSGVFTGLSKHVTTGGVSVVRTDEGVTVVMAEDFSLDGAPDPKVGFGHNGVYDSEAQLGHLASKSGAQTYVVPASVEVERYNEIYIWCDQFSVPLGVAKLR
ncbi:MAG: DM13 domain-containing protein [Gammaproteobacteria bacterium]